MAVRATIVDRPVLPAVVSAVSYSLARWLEPRSERCPFFASACCVCRYMLMPDHAPSHPDYKDEVQVGKGTAFAFQFGYIIAIIQAVKLGTEIK